jgi:predicted small metal-binding protein
MGSYRMTYQFSCRRDGCSFELRCDSGQEAARLARAHARVSHRDRTAPADLDRWLERIEAA